MAWSTVGEWFVRRCTVGEQLVHTWCTLVALFVTDKNYDKMAISTIIGLRFPVLYEK